MSTDDDLRGSAPVMSTKDVLLEVRADVKALTKTVDVIASQDLDARVTRLESWADRINGRVSILMVLVTIIGGLLGIVIGAVTLVRVIAGGLDHHHFKVGIASSFGTNVLGTRVRYRGIVRP